MTEHEQDSKFTKNKRQDGENKMDIQEWIIFAIELIGTVAFSASGAMVGIECSMDIFGVIVLGVSTAVGGGMVRDVILGKVPSALLHPVYVLYISAGNICRMVLVRSMINLCWQWIL